MTKLKIEDFEDKKTKADKRYTRFKTSDGWMSCFNEKTCEALKKECGNEIDLELKAQGDFKNIVNFLGGSEEKEDTPAKDSNKPFPSSKNQTFYTAYAKDIFNVLVLMEPNNPTNTVMDKAIALVKQARDSF